jgi:hypothetical protein
MQAVRCGLCALPLAAVFATAAQADIVARVITIHIDQVGLTHQSDLGKTHEARILYDDAQIDPSTHRVKILHEQHTPMLIPAHPDAVIMPVANARLDLGSKPYRYHRAASPGVACRPDGKPMFGAYTIVFDENTHRMTIRNQQTGALELSGPYVVGDTVLTGPAIQSVIKDSPKASPYPPSCP